MSKYTTIRKEVDGYEIIITNDPDKCYDFATAVGYRKKKRFEVNCIKGGKYARVTAPQELIDDEASFLAFVREWIIKRIEKL